MLPTDFYQQLSELSLKQQQLFCLGLLQRMSPNYQLFAESTEFAESLALRKFLDLFWEYLGSGSARINFSVQQEKFQVLIPEASQFDMYGVYPAIDCCVLAELLFSSILEKGAFPGESASQVSLAGVLMFLQLQTGEDDEARLADQPLIQSELGFQQAWRQKVAETDFSSEQIRQLKTFSRDQDISNLGIALGD